MKLKRIEFAFLLLAVFMGACEYNPKDIYERPVTKDYSFPQIQTIVLDINYDTIFLYPEKIINFRFSSSNQAIRMVKLVIDDKPKFTVNSDNGTFDLSLGTLDDGMHTLAIEVYTATGTNSIAELMGAEVFLFSKSWKLFVDNGYKTKTRAGASNGYLNVTWQKYRDYDFKEYVVSRELSYNNEVVIKKLKSTVFIDSSYVGEGAKYIVKVRTIDERLIDWGNVELPRELPQLKLQASESYPYVIQWGKNKYYNAVDTFKLRQDLNNANKFATVKITRNPDDSTYVLEKGLFADGAEFILKFVPKNGNIRYTPDYYGNFESQTEVILGFYFMNQYTTRSIAQVSQDEFVYLKNCDSLIRYSVSRKQSVEQSGNQSCNGCAFMNVTFSASGKYIYNYISCKNSLMLITSNNMHNNITRDMQPLYGQSYATTIYVSDVGTAIVNKGNAGFDIYDINTNKALASYHNTNSGGQGLFMSPDGNYLFVEDDSLRLVRFNNSQFTNVWSHNRSFFPKYFGFDGVNPEQMFLWDGTTFSVKLCNDFSEVYEFPLSDNSVLDIDFYNKEILTYNAGHLYVKSYLNGSLIKDLPVNVNPSFWYNSFPLINHAIVSYKGVIYFIK